MTERERPYIVVSDSVIWLSVGAGRAGGIWVVGAGRWRDPDEDLPKDFEERRAEHYASLRKPLDPAGFIAGLRQEMEAELAALDDALPRLDWVDIAGRRSGAIKLTPLDAAPEPRNLRRIKNEVARRWTAVPLIDVLKESVLRTGCLQAALVYVNTLMLQDVLADEEWAGMLGPADRRGLTPLFWQHVRPYGEVRLDMGARLQIGGAG